MPIVVFWKTPQKTVAIGSFFCNVIKIYIATHGRWIDVKFSTSCIFLFILVVLKLRLCRVKFFSVVNPTKIGSHILEVLVAFLDLFLK